MATARRTLSAALSAEHEPENRRSRSELPRILRLHPSTPNDHDYLPDPDHACASVQEWAHDTQTRAPFSRVRPADRARPTAVDSPGDRCDRAPTRRPG